GGRGLPEKALHGVPDAAARGRSGWDRCLGRSLDHRGGNLRHLHDLGRDLLEDLHVRERLGTAYAIDGQVLLFLILPHRLLRRRTELTVRRQTERALSTCCSADMP